MTNTKGSSRKEFLVHEIIMKNILVKRFCYERCIILCALELYTLVDGSFGNYQFLLKLPYFYNIKYINLSIGPFFFSIN